MWTKVVKKKKILGWNPTGNLRTGLRFMWTPSTKERVCLRVRAVMQACPRRAVTLYSYSKPRNASFHTLKIPIKYPHPSWSFSDSKRVSAFQKKNKVKQHCQQVSRLAALCRKHKHTKTNATEAFVFVLRQYIPVLRSASSAPWDNMKVTNGGGW